jgi:hypothetical protein
MKKEHAMTVKQRKRTPPKIKTLYLGDCNICNKQIYNNDAFVVFADKSRRCWECYASEATKKN